MLSRNISIFPKFWMKNLFLNYDWHTCTMTQKFICLIYLFKNILGQLVTGSISFTKTLHQRCDCNILSANTLTKQIKMWDFGCHRVNLLSCAHQCSVSDVVLWVESSSAGDDCLIECIPIWLTIVIVDSKVLHVHRPLWLQRLHGEEKKSIQYYAFSNMVHFGVYGGN